MSYIVENVGDVIEDSEDGVHARPVVLDHWRSDEFGVERIPERMKTIQREVGENVDALAEGRKRSHQQWRSLGQLL